MIRLIVFVFLLILARISANFPKSPEPCKFEDTKCIQDVLTFLLNNRPNGDSSLNLVNFDPLEVASINIKQGAESPVNINLHFRNTKLSGLKHSTITAVKGFGKDLTQENEIHFHSPLISLVGDYKINGRILILPVHGNGKSNITLVNSDVVAYFSGAPKVEPDGTFFKIKHIRLSIKPKRVYFDFSNLFDGDKVLGDNMNRFINENWQDIFGEVEGSIDSAFSQVSESIINNVFKKYPYEKFFANP